MTDISALPVVVIGAGPVGLAAAAQLVERNLPFVILEKSATVAAVPKAWGHVRLFSPWRYNVDAAAARLLSGSGWQFPDLDALPTGETLATDYLEPLARHRSIAPNLTLEARVTGITREGLDKMASREREASPLLVHWIDGCGTRHRTLARAVIDASGTFDRPNPMGVDGLPVDGEEDAADLVAYGLPDVLGRARPIYDGKRVLVVGGGHSAINVVLDLIRLKAGTPGTEVLWALRRSAIGRIEGGGLDDKLPERGALGLAALSAIDAGNVAVLAPFAAERIERHGGGLAVTARIGGNREILDVDRIVVATGFRPSIDFLREVRVALDPIVEAPPQLAPLIDPNLHSCGTVPPHGVEELAHPEPDLYIVGAKSYGRAPTFLMATGYEQVRSIVAEIAGDRKAAREVHLVLPETGVCSATALTSECCGGPAPDADSCCRADADAKSADEAGCGCLSSDATVQRCCGEVA